MKTQILKTVLITSMGLALVNCSGVKFGTKETTTQSSASGTATDPGSPTNDAGGTLTQPGGVPVPAPTPAPIPAPTPEALPKVVFVGPLCQPKTNCLVEFDLKQAMPKNVDFDWRTNDTLFQTPVPAGADYLYARPNYHYVPTSGHITFLAGETKKQVYVQNINPDLTKIVIGVRMSVCTYGGNLHNCVPDFFEP